MRCTCGDLPANVTTVRGPHHKTGCPMWISLDQYDGDLIPTGPDEFEGAKRNPDGTITPGGPMTQSGEEIG